MDTMSAFAMGEANRGRESMVFDWNKAAKLIKESNAKSAIAGLSSDMEWTSDTIFSDGNIVEDGHTYLASTWATPVLVIGDDSWDEIDCYVMASKTDWDAGTVWPESAKKIINGES